MSEAEPKYRCLTEKYCSGCRQWQRKAEFTKNRSTPDGFGYRCAACRQYERWLRSPEEIVRRREQKRKYLPTDRKRERNRLYMECFRRKFPELAKARKKASIKKARRDPEKAARERERFEQLRAMHRERMKNDAEYREQMRARHRRNYQRRKAAGLLATDRARALAAERNRRYRARKRLRGST